MKRTGAVFLLCVMLIGCQSGKDEKTVVENDLGVTRGNQSENSGRDILDGGIGYYLDKQAKEFSPIVETKRTENGIIIKLKGDALFDLGSFNLKTNAVAKIDQITQILVKYPENRIKVIGHTDSQGLDGLNATLSRRKAETVFNRLVKNGILPRFVQTQGMGEMQPVASNSTKNGRALNRRIELEISIDEKTFQKKNYKKHLR